MPSGSPRRRAQPAGGTPRLPAPGLVRPRAQAPGGWVGVPRAGGGRGFRGGLQQVCRPAQQHPGAPGSHAALGTDGVPGPAAPASRGRPAFPSRFPGDVIWAAWGCLAVPWGLSSKGRVFGHPWKAFLLEASARSGASVGKSPPSLASPLLNKTRSLHLPLQFSSGSHF